MILCIDAVLPQERVDEIARALLVQTFDSGAATAGWAARDVKNNLQLPPHSPLRLQIQKVVEDALQGNETFVSAALPRAQSEVLVSRTAAGGGYGNHVDNAVMGQPPVRTDLAFTLFLSRPGDYDGGELVIDEPQGEQSFKLPAGQMVLYPATTLHRVNPVTRGVRHVVAGWVQSLVRDPRLRELLFELDLARREVFSMAPRSRAFELLHKSYSNLLRMHAEV
ncbi:MAG: Fe2+-dependent dioxygenase [Rubrivivax sp.]|jgi:PKHD-type hydroxylase